MRGSELMSDKKPSTEPVRVELGFHDWLTVGGKKINKVVEIDRDEWNEMEPYERRDHVEDLLHTWLEEKFELTYEVLEADSFDDVTDRD